MRMLALSLLAFLALGGAIAEAATDQFTISQEVINNDTTSPSIPLNLTATPVSTDQIDLSWSASTDNVGVTGYQVFRDAVQIATTSSPSYADTGLLPDTSYDYTVTAFDAAGNFSAHSATTTATTDAEAEPPAEEEDDGTISGSQGFRISSLAIDTGWYSAEISWETSRVTRSILEWGTSGDYGMGTLAERAYSEEHATRISGLLPDTQYFFRITARDSRGIDTVREGSFRTDALPDSTPPENVGNLEGVKDGDDALLSWQNPAEDFAKVRIVRKDGGYPADPFDGTVIFEGNADAYRDRDVFKGSDVRYYGVFAYDESGNAASGAVVRVARPGIPLPEPPVSPFARPFKFGDLIFLQNGREISYIGTEVAVDGAHPLEIRIPYGKLPEHLKTILVSVVDAHDSTKQFTFLLRIDPEKTAYSARIGALKEGGDYPLLLSIFDYKERTISKTEGTLLVEAAETSRGPSIPLAAFFEKLGYLSFTFLFILILLLIYIVLLVRRRLAA